MSTDPVLPSSETPERWRDLSLSSDLAAVPKLLRATDMFSAEEIAIARSLLLAPEEEGYRFVFVDRDRALAGFACFGRIPATIASFDLYWLAVDPLVQRSGYGRRLLRTVEARVRVLGGNRLYIDTSARPQYLPTRAFYSAMGYHVAAELPDYFRPGEGKVIFCKALSEA